MGLTTFITRLETGSLSVIDAARTETEELKSPALTVNEQVPYGVLGFGNTEHALDAAPTVINTDVIPPGEHILRPNWSVTE